MKSEKQKGIKSALELAMEKLQTKGQEPESLSEEKKSALEEVTKELQAKIAELEIMTKQQAAEAEALGDPEKAGQLGAAMAAEIGRLRRRAEKQRKKIREQSD